MSWMFGNCTSLTTLNLSNFNTANVTNMSYMFSSCTNLTTIFVNSSWIIDPNTTSTKMFYNSTALIGGYGTHYNVSHVDATYARIDAPGTPGYFTDVTGLSIPSIRVNVADGTKYLKTSNATITIIDDLGLSRGSYSIKYYWSLIPNNVYTTSINVDQGTNVGTVNVSLPEQYVLNREAYTGEGQIVVETISPIANVSGGLIPSGTIVSTDMYLDNIPPTKGNINAIKCGSDYQISISGANDNIALSSTKKYEYSPGIFTDVSRCHNAYYSYYSNSSSYTLPGSGVNYTSICIKINDEAGNSTYHLATNLGNGIRCLW
jgi:surface protein